MRREDAHATDVSAEAACAAATHVAFCSLSSTGPDPGVDEILRLRAVRPALDERGSEELDLVCRPRTVERLAERAALLGVEPAMLAAAPRPALAWNELDAFAHDLPLVVADAESFAAWRDSESARSSRGGAEPVAIGLGEIAALFFPGRRTAPELGIAASARARAPRIDPEPARLRDALARLAQRQRARAPALRELAARGYSAVATGLSVSDPAAATRLLNALALANEASEDASSDAGPERIQELASELEPRWTEDARTAGERAALPPHLEAPLPFDADDLALLDALFLEHLPATFANQRGAYRESQHRVAREVARTLGAEGGELLLVHAPTGTGKTLAYLLPAMLWSRRHGVRVGIATYTRALQEQAMDREVPRAFAALDRAGAASGIEITTLKGRENYLCWRALERSIPDAHAGWEEWLAWTQLALFALGDATGDLDRMPLRAPIRLDSSGAYERALAELVRQVRARSSCCSHEADRATCAADVARRRAERSHVVITNHSFALARQDFFRHVVFDECEHLHDQALAAWSHSLPQRRVRDLLDGLHGGRSGRSSSLLERIARKLVPGTRSHDELERCTGLVERAHGAFGTLALEANGFVGWRTETARSVGERDAHALLRQYAEGEHGEPLVRARCELSAAFGELEAGLAILSERLSALDGRAFARLRRTLDLARADIGEVLEALGAWIPVDAGAPRFGPQTFHDVQVDARGDLALVARVLLPNEYLGRHYHPRLATGTFLSATSWLQEGFDAALGYLGLDRAAAPAPDEERAPARVRTFRAPEVFDYGRVLVAVPRDAPHVSREKEEFLSYAGNFLAQLGERTHGRVLGLFTNAEDLKRVGARLEGFFRARRIPFWYQNMKGTSKEELGELFRSRGDSVLLGVDTFWYGADFPGEVLEYLVIARLPYGVPDGYHHAQCAALGTADQRRRIYLPRALSKFRQGFGRLMRSVDDRGCVFVLDPRILDPRHRPFLRELPLRNELDAHGAGARLVRGDTRTCIEEALTFMGVEPKGGARGAAGAEAGASDREAELPPSF